MSSNRNTTSTDTNNNLAKKIVNYNTEVEKLEKFLETFETKNAKGEKHYKYMQKLQEIADRTAKQIDIEIDDMRQYHDIDENTITNIVNNTARYLELFSAAIDHLLPDSRTQTESEDILDILYKQKKVQSDTEKVNNTATVPTNGTDSNSSTTAPKNSNSFPQELRRRYELHIVPESSSSDIPLRQIRAQHIGKLITVKGIVTRITEVKPLITVATYTCQNCSCEIYQEVNSRTFMPITKCPSESCKGKSGLLQMQTRGSKFIKYQEIKIQELSEQVPIGHVPRTLSIHCRGELTRQCTPGDILAISGIFLPTPYTSGKTRSGGLLADTFLECMKLIKYKKSYANYILTPEIANKVKEIAEEPNAYTKLARSLAPEIYGCEDIKKSLLLLMVGGAHRELPDGMKIRGDINVCLMGDPGVAKSQLLKHISSIAPRGIYTSGKGSSGVGLTAAVVKDPVTNELILEGGSLVLADKGICCIDEFDKMDESDRTAIHEVMEQQTISIAKAGITTTLNARTSILAAANPAYGRWNLRRSAAENINLPAALLSRFDLLFLLLDKPDLETDLALAEHVTYVHKHYKNPVLQMEVIPPEIIRAYISRAKKISPYVPPELTDYIVMAYTNLRHEESQASEELTYTTARTLLAILRVGTALARIRFDEEVTQADIDEAMRLLHVSKVSIIENKKKKSGIDPISAIYEIIRRLSEQMATASDNSSRNPVMKMSEILPRVIAKGYTQQQLDSCLQDYSNLNVWHYSENKNELYFL